MRFSFFLSAALFFCSLALGAQADSPVGRWATTDDETGEKKSIIEIYEEGGKFKGRIAEILTENKDAVCDKCTGKDKGAPMLGLVIIDGLKAEEDYWAGGTILDPQKGAEYRLSVWYEDDPDVLYIRGKHWTGLYRTQTWKRM